MGLPIEREPTLDGPAWVSRRYRDTTESGISHNSGIHHIRYRGICLVPVANHKSREASNEHSVHHRRGHQNENSHFI